jgi:hypothetical protein
MAFRLHDKQWHKVFERMARAARQRALIVTPFLQRTTLEDLLGNRPKEVRVITRFNLSEFMRGVSDIKALEYLLDVGAEVKGIRHLHSKVYVFGPSTAIIASANLTQAALYRNAEFGIESDSPEFVKASLTYFESLWDKAGSSLDTSKLALWKDCIAEEKHLGGGGKRESNLDDYGSDLRFDESSELHEFKALAGPLPGQWFVKFFGTSGDRAPRGLDVIQEVEGSATHEVLSYPRRKRPLQVRDGDVVFVGRLVKELADIMIYGRAFCTRYNPQTDNATAADIKRRQWRRNWPHYVRVSRPEFVNGQLGDCVSLYDLMRDLGSDAFASTYAHALRGKGNIDPRKAYLRQASVRLTPYAAQILNTRLEDVFSKLGRITDEELQAID